MFWLEVELEEAPGDPSPWAAAVAGRPVLLSVSNAHTRLMIRRQLLSVGALPAPAEPAGALEAVRGGEPFAAALVADDQPDLVQALEERRIPWVALRPAGSRGAGSGSSPAGFLIRPVRREQLRALLERLLATVGTPPPARPPRKGARVLVVEDNPVNQTVAREMLGRLGYRVAVVSSGRDALEALEAVPYDVVLMDVQMPHLDGLQTTRAIRQRWPDGGRT